MNLYTYSGRISFPEGSPGIEDIAVSLSRECRYAGAGVHWWPVALHTFVVCDLLPPALRIHGLLHDAAECIIGDVPKPAKIPAIEELEDTITRGIYAGFGFTLPTKEQAKVVKEADRRTLHGEVFTVGTEALRQIYPEDRQAAAQVLLYHSLFPVTDCVDPNGRCVKEFIRRFKLYQVRRV